MTDDRPERVTILRKWLIAARPWALPASTMPVLFGTSLAIVIGGAQPDFTDFLAALLAMMTLHAAANMLSDVFDFKRGLDRDITPISRGHRPRLAQLEAGRPPVRSFFLSWAQFWGSSLP